jgi:integrase
MGKNGSLGYQMMKALQGIFRPGHSRDTDKRRGREYYIRGIQTMRCMVADLFQFADFIRGSWPEVRDLERVTPEMAHAFVDALIERGDSGGRIARVSASLRKLDAACRQAAIFSKDAPELLPYAGEVGTTSFHSKPRPVAYSEADANRIIAHVTLADGEIGRLLQLMRIAGLRVSEAAYLRGIDMDAATMTLTLHGGVNHTKGGRPRQVTIAPEHQPFLMKLQEFSARQADGHVFSARRSLPTRARRLVRAACAELGIRPLGTHGLRKTFATLEYHQEKAGGAGEKTALNRVAQQLGHNRTVVVKQSYLDITNSTQADVYFGRAKKVQT